MHKLIRQNVEIQKCGLKCSGWNTSIWQIRETLGNRNSKVKFPLLYFWIICKIFLPSPMCICSNSKNAWEYSTASLSICLVQNFIVYNFVPIQNYNNGSIALLWRNAKCNNNFHYVLRFVKVATDPIYRIYVSRNSHNEKRFITF